MGGAFFTQWASGFGARPEHPRHGLFALDPEELRVWPPGASRAETRALGIPERERERESLRGCRTWIGDGGAMKSLTGIRMRYVCKMMQAFHTWMRVTESFI